MNLKRMIVRVVASLTKTHIYRKLPRGIDFTYDLRDALPGYHVDVVFDVGANVGQSAQKYLRAFPGAQVYCFEPVSETFDRLRVNLEDHERIHLFKLALGASKGSGEMVKTGTPDLFFLATPSDEQPLAESVPTETVRIVGLDEFTSDVRIERISYLKIDTEGGDLDVLAGGVSMLSNQRIDFVEVEAGMNPGNERHVRFETLKGYLESRQYYLFGIYEQIPEWPTRDVNLRRCNAVFISSRLMKEKT